MNTATATPPAECWAHYRSERAVMEHGAITRTLALVTGYSYANLRRLLLSFGEKQWRPRLHQALPQAGMFGYVSILPNGVVVTIKSHYYIKGVIADQWWHLYWPTGIDPEDSSQVINLVHQIDTLKEARALIEEYVRNDYTVPEGACTL